MKKQLFILYFFSVLSVPNVLCMEADNPSSPVKKSALSDVAATEGQLSVPKRNDPFKMAKEYLRCGAEIAEHNAEKLARIYPVRKHNMFVEVANRGFGATSNTHQGSERSSLHQERISIEGEGFFILTLEDGSKAYSRHCTLQVDDRLRLVHYGHCLYPPITFSEQPLKIECNSSGHISTNNGENKERIGQLLLAKFLKPEHLIYDGDAMYRQTDQAGDMLIGSPGTNGIGIVRLSFIDNIPLIEIEEVPETHASYKQICERLKAESALAAALDDGHRGIALLELKMRLAVARAKEECLGVDDEPR
ncbi:MAG TPA: hypothetical protein DIC42_00610 [Holosporales bacterium]|nr:hypothetical protein [Holosporales bacterium]